MHLLRANRHPTELQGGISYPLPLHQVYTMASHSDSPSRLLGSDDNHSMPDYVSESSSDEHLIDYDATGMHDTHKDQGSFCHLLTRVRWILRKKWWD